MGLSLAGRGHVQPTGWLDVRPRPYQGLDDLDRMKAVITLGRRVSPHSGYPHIGDLDWWLFYGAQPDDPGQIITLWETTEGQVLGWVFFTPRRFEFDLALMPELRGTVCEEYITAWAEDQLAGSARTAEARIKTFAWADDRERCALLEQRGYTGENFLAYFAQPLNVPLPEPALPPGFVFLDQMDETYSEQRAAVHFDAFSPSQMTPERYRRFMRAPGYDPGLDVVVVAPDGRFAAFAMGWIDPITKISVFEPVGTRRDYQRRGLGKAALLEGMRRLQALGMVTATVCADARNEGNLAFYRSAGFYQVNTVRAYRKTGG